MDATKANGINLQKMTHAEFVAFLAGFLRILKLKTAVCTALKPLVDELERLMALLEQSLVASRTNSYTKLVNDADDYRDMIHSGLIYLLRAYQKCGDNAKMSAARSLFLACREFGLTSLRSANHREETALLDAMAEKLKGAKYAADLTALPEVATFLTALEAAMADFKAVFNSKATEEAEKLDYTTLDIRVQMVPIYRQIIGAAEAMASVGSEPQYGEFIHELNGLITISK